jgi:chromate transporter
VTSPAAPAHPSPAALFVVFLRLGALAWGGLGAAIALIDRELVVRRGWVTSEEVRRALAFTLVLPGSTVVQVVAYLGWRLGRWPGAVIAAAAFVTPTFAIMVAAAALLVSAPSGPVIDGILLGFHVAVVGLLISTLVRMSGELRPRRMHGLALLAFGASLLSVNAAVVVGLAGLAWVAIGDR